MHKDKLLTELCGSQRCNEQLAEFTRLVLGGRGEMSIFNFVATQCSLEAEQRPTLHGADRSPRRSALGLARVCPGVIFTPYCPWALFHGHTRVLGCFPCPMRPPCLPPVVPCSHDMCHCAAGPASRSPRTSLGARTDVCLRRMLVVFVSLGNWTTVIVLNTFSGCFVQFAIPCWVITGLLFSPQHGG